MNILAHWDDWLASAAAIGALSHALNTFPTPKNRYGQWALGVSKYVVGQRITAINAFNGLQSEVTAITTEEKNALKNGSTMVVTKIPGDDLKPVSIIQPDPKG